MDYNGARWYLLAKIKHARANRRITTQHCSGIAANFARNEQKLLKIIRRLEKFTVK